MPTDTATATSERTGELLEYAALFAAPPAPPVTLESPCTRENLARWGLEDWSEDGARFDRRIRWEGVTVSPSRTTIGSALSVYHRIVGNEVPPTRFSLHGHTLLLGRGGLPSS